MNRLSLSLSPSPLSSYSNRVRSCIRALCCALDLDGGVWESRSGSNSTGIFARPQKTQARKRWKRLLSMDVSSFSRLCHKSRAISLSLSRDNHRAHKSAGNVVGAEAEAEARAKAKVSQCVSEFGILHCPPLWILLLGQIVFSPNQTLKGPTGNCVSLWL